MSSRLDVVTDRYRVRAMSKADLPQAGRLAGKLVRLHYEFDPKRFLHLANPEAGYQRYFAGELESSDVILLVAHDTTLDAAADGAIVGYVYARLEPRSYNELLDACAKLHDIYVDERARGHGIGERLVRETLRIAKERGAPRVVLLTAVQNESAQRLFAKTGFRTTMLEMTAEVEEDADPKTPAR